MRTRDAWCARARCRDPRVGLEPLDSFTALSVDVETPGEDGGFALAGLLGERDAGSIWS
ncbi:hypothetical protein [Streptomyces sp. NPDC001642]|uniref:hypothetical protein n=1 Tax=Streptomyces sp. NPDC001642 TaxID=3154392 RepID=UPI00332253B1